MSTQLNAFVMISLPTPGKNRKFDCIVSWLPLFHIPDRHNLLHISTGLLEKGCLFYTEDMYYRQTMNADEAEELREGMYTDYIVAIFEQVSLVG